MLLINKGAKHTLQDDLESFLHVLSWVALRYMPHGYDADELDDIMKACFDHAYEGLDGSVKGGRNKKEHIISGAIPRSGFHNPEITTLLRTLNRIFAARYQDPSSLEGLEEDLYEPTLRAYQKALEALANSDWMLSTFRNAVEDRTVWPKDDESKPNPILAKPVRGRKRKSNLEPGEPPQQKMRIEVPPSPTPWSTSRPTQGSRRNRRSGTTRKSENTSEQVSPLRRSTRRKSALL